MASKSSSPSYCNVCGYVWKLSTQNVTPPKTENNDGDRTCLESHALIFSHCPLVEALPAVVVPAVVVPAVVVVVPAGIVVVPAVVVVVTLLLQCCFWKFGRRHPSHMCPFLPPQRLGGPSAVSKKDRDVTSTTT